MAVQVDPGSLRDVVRQLGDVLRIVAADGHNGGVQVSATPEPAAVGASDGKGTAAMIIGVIPLLVAGAALAMAVLD
jgi:hypothetical protein